MKCHLCISEYKRGKFTLFLNLHRDLSSKKRNSKDTTHCDSPNNKADRSVSVQCFMSTVLNENILQQ